MILLNICSLNKKGGWKMKKHINKKVVIIIVIILTILIGVSAAGAGYFYFKTSKIKRTKISKTNSDLGISTQTSAMAEKYNEITNIALFGLDTREKDEASRSDCIMIITLDGMHNKMKISSIMRDTYVNVEGYGMTKITHAYAYGGAQLAIKTINQNFGLNIKDFIKVDFFSLEKIVDSIGGIDINIASDEVQLLNNYVDEVSSIEKVTPEHISKSGLQRLNGRQAVAYCRIRYTTGDDFKRTERQRNVLELIINKAKSQGTSGIMNTINVMLPYIETSMTNSDILKLSYSVISSKLYDNLEQERFPVDGYCWAINEGIWYLGTDLKATASQMQDYIFKDIKPVPKTPLVQ